MRTPHTAPTAATAFYCASPRAAFLSTAGEYRANVEFLSPHIMRQRHKDMHALSQFMSVRIIWYLTIYLYLSCKDVAMCGWLAFGWASFMTKRGEFSRFNRYQNRLEV